MLLNLLYEPTGDKTMITSMPHTTYHLQNLQSATALCYRFIIKNTETSSLAQILEFFVY